MKTKHLNSVAGVSIILATLLPNVANSADPCDFRRAFSRPDEQGAQRVNVYEGEADAALQGARPLAFVSSLKVNTDGTRISYKVDDPRARNGAINNILNAMPRGRTIPEFEEIARNDWRPLSETWQILLPNVIERDRNTGKPCVGAGNYLVSMTADTSVADGQSRIGDCDQSKWLDALSIPALVVPGGSEFQQKGVRTRSFVVVMTLGEPARLAYGIVGDTGPRDEIGEASVEMNRMLNGLPAGEKPTSYKDAIRRFQAPKSVVMIFPGAANRLAYPITPERVAHEVRAKFEAWGGQARLESCLEDVPESGR